MASSWNVKQNTAQPLQLEMEGMVSAPENTHEQRKKCVNYVLQIHASSCVVRSPLSFGPAICTKQTVGLRGVYRVYWNFKVFSTQQGYMYVAGSIVTSQFQSELVYVCMSQPTV